MANARTEEVEQSLQDGNCAFNSFALAICNRDTLSKIAQLIYNSGSTPDIAWHQFIKLAAAQLNVAENWVAVKTEMLRLRKDNKAEFQIKLAKALRQLTHDLARTFDCNEYIYYYNKTVDVFQAAYQEYDPRDKNTKDDIFCRHKFIKYKFKEFKSNKTDMNVIMLWWMDEGYAAFLDAMNQDRKHAGDLELARLARYFRLSLLRQDGPSMYRNFGYFPNINLEQFAEIDEPVRKQIMVALINRGIVDKYSSEPGNGFKFNLSTMAEILPLLQRIEYFDLVAGYIRSQQSDIYLTGTPNDWPEKCINELVQRNVITRKNNSREFIFSRDSEKALRTIDAIPQLEWVASLCSKHLEAHPEIMLKHQFFLLGSKKIGHWDHVIVKESARTKALNRFGLYKSFSLFDGTAAAKYAYLCLTKNTHQ